MLTRRTFTLASLAWTTTGCDVGSDISSDARLGVGALHFGVEANALREGALRIDAATGLLGDLDLIDTFQRLYPGIALDYRRAISGEVHTNFLQEAGAGRPTTDLLISSAMDLQFKLVNDGFAQPYVSSERQHLPDWAVWKNEAYAITADPLVFAYNKALMPAADLPRSHDELTDLLRRKPHEYRGKITTYDPERSGTGYLYYTQDLMLSRDTLDLVRAMARTQPRYHVSGVDMRNGLSRGEHLLAYNMVNSFTAIAKPQHPDIDVVFPSDYTLVMSRIVLIPRTARHPFAARLFLDFLLSELGQSLIASHHVQPVRNGVPIKGPAPPSDVVRRIQFGPSLLANLDEFRRRRVLHEWHRASSDAV